MASEYLTCHRDDKGSIHGIDAQGSGTGRQVEVRYEVGQLAEDQGPSVDAKEGVLEQGEIQYFGFYGRYLSRRAGM